MSERLPIEATDRRCIDLLQEVRMRLVDQFELLPDAVIEVPDNIRNSPNAVFAKFSAREPDNDYSVQVAKFKSIEARVVIPDFRLVRKIPNNLAIFKAVENTLTSAPINRYREKEDEYSVKAEKPAGGRRHVLLHTRHSDKEGTITYIDSYSDECIFNIDELRLFFDTALDLMKLDD